MPKWSELVPRETGKLATKLLARAIEETNMGKHIYPPTDQILRALHLTQPENVKACIVGQDPYHTPNQANGLAFSINPGNPLQPSLINIFKELKNDLNIPIPENGDLRKWAEEGVLLLNATLTVYEHKPNSCKDWGWIAVTKEILRASAQLPQPIVYIGWGANAIDLITSALPNSPIVCLEKGVYLQRKTNKAILTASHPSPFSCRRPCKENPSFFGSKPFSKTNKLLIDMGNNPVDWTL